MNKLLIERTITKCSEALNIAKPDVELHEFDNDENSAMFIPSNYSIVVNSLLLDSTNPIEIFITICHEMRHAYQYMMIKDQDGSKEISKWKAEFDHYCSPQDEGFLEQEIEIDAIAFAHNMTLKIFNEKSVIPIEIKERVTERLNQISKIIKE